MRVLGLIALSIIDVISILVYPVRQGSRQVVIGLKRLATVFDSLRGWRLSTKVDNVAKTS